jgi:hypothetical protein
MLVGMSLAGSLPRPKQLGIRLKKKRKGKKEHPPPKMKTKKYFPRWNEIGFLDS